MCFEKLNTIRELTSDEKATDLISRKKKRQFDVSVLT